MGNKNIKISDACGVRKVTLNRPEVRNALDEPTISALTRAFARLPAGVRVIVLAGAGKDFCAGADVRWMRRASGYPPAKNRADARRLVGLCRAVEECPAPVVARLHGGVYGGGLGLVAACDIAVAGEGTVFCFSECRLGILPAVVSSFVLPKIGPSHTRRLYFTAETFGAELALRVGLIHETAPETELDARVDGLARQILRNGPGAVRLAKGYLRRLGELPREKRFAFSVDTLVRARRSPEGREGFAAFLEKRPPSWAAGPAGAGRR